MHTGEVRMDLEISRLNNRGKILDKAKLPKDKIRIINSHNRIDSNKNNINNGPNNLPGNHKLNKFLISSKLSNNNNKIKLIRSQFNKMMNKLSLKF